MRLRPDFRAAVSLSKTVLTVSPANRLHNQFLQHNIGDGTLPQAIPGGTRLTGVGGAHKKMFKWHIFLQLVSFTVDGDPL